MHFKLTWTELNWTIPFYYKAYNYILQSSLLQKFSLCNSLYTFSRCHLAFLNESYWSSLLELLILSEEMNKELQSSDLYLFYNCSMKNKIHFSMWPERKNNLYCPFTLNKWSAILAYKNYNEPYLKHFLDLWISNKYFAFQKCSNFCRNLRTMPLSFIFDISLLE